MRKASDQNGRYSLKGCLLKIYKPVMPIHNFTWHLDCRPMLRPNCKVNLVHLSKNKSGMHNSLVIAGISYKEFDGAQIDSVQLKEYPINLQEVYYRFCRFV